MEKNFKDIYNILNKNEFYPLWSIEEPYIFIEPKNIYKKLIIFIFIFQEFFIALMIFDAFGNPEKFPIPPLSSQTGDKR